jgi:hypothetical protein
MNKYRSMLAAIAAILFYTLTDILIWQRIFEANQLTEYAPIYHNGWFVSLAGYATVGALLMWGSWKDCVYYLMALFIGAFSGLEDVLYYVLDRKPMPDSLPWLAGNPLIYHVSRTGVLFSVFFWLFALGILYFALYWWHRERKEVHQNNISD